MVKWWNEAPRWGRVVTALVVCLVLALGILKLCVRWLEPRMVFYPDRGVQETPAALSVPFVDLQIPTADGETLHAWWLDNPSARARVIFFHGNGANLSNRVEWLADIRAHGFSVLAVDYRGYGSSTGSPSEQGLYRDADATLAAFERRFGRQGPPVVYWGGSLGCAVAAYAASRHRPDGLVMESPFPNLRRLIQGRPLLQLLALFSSYRFPTDRFLDGYDGPLLIVHGDADSMTPFSAGRALFDGARTSQKTFVTIPGADHNDLHSVNPNLYWRAIQSWTSTLAR